MYKLKCDGMITVHNTIKSAKKEADTMIKCGSFDAMIYRGNTACWYRKYDTGWSRALATKLA